MGPGWTCRDLLEDRDWLKTLAFPAPSDPAARDEEAEQKVERTYAVEVSGKRFEVEGPRRAVRGWGSRATAARLRAPLPQAPRRPSIVRPKAAGTTAGGGSDTLSSPLQGNMWKVLVKQGDTVEQGQLLCIIEAMKMENEITAHKAGTITELPIAEGVSIQAGAPIATIKSAREDG